MIARLYFKMAFNNFVAEFDSNKLNSKDSNSKSVKEEELEAEIERLREQLKQANFEKVEMTSKYEKLSSICRSQRQEIQELKQAMATRTPSPNKHHASPKVQSSTTPKRGESDWSTPNSEPKPWQAFAKDPKSHQQPLSKANSPQSVRTRNANQKIQVSQASSEFESWGFGADSFTASVAASTQISGPSNEGNSSQHFGGEKTVGSRPATQPAGGLVSSSCYLRSYSGTLLSEPWYLYFAVMLQRDKRQVERVHFGALSVITTLRRLKRAFFWKQRQVCGVEFAAQTTKNITLGSSLLASYDDSSSWKSPSGDFAFGFRRLENQSSFLLAIWYDKIPEKTVVWTANGQNPVLKGSIVELTKDGQFKLNNPQGHVIWKADMNSTEVAYAAMLDTGNLVLANRNCLGELRKFHRHHPTNSSTRNWSSSIFSSNAKVTLDYDGVLVQYAHPKASVNGTWDQSWFPVCAVPDNICTDILGRLGSGACGFNGICIIGLNRRPTCECPPGYSIFDADNKFGGCKLDRVPKCEEIVAVLRDGSCWKKKLPLSSGRMDPSTPGTAFIKVMKPDIVGGDVISSTKEDQESLVLVGSVL
ncbi:hypothetical protein GH714_014956 [Hevea brasiliensis]|uniref:Bulb-type lectin domain-containing protein n=1 Tax=Hevea brasiliensis TaxID=3981 RepID=A0A6A6N5A0_HEVBR|nr:hypothetical protein GH714_014956 [Hevea brasiliensis]